MFRKWRIWWTRRRLEQVRLDMKVALLAGHIAWFEQLHRKRAKLWSKLHKLTKGE